MGYSEFVEWVAFLSTEPVGDARGDIQTAMLCAMLANTNRRKRDKKIKVSQFIPDYWQDKSRPENLMRKFRAMSQDATMEPEPDAARNARSRANRQDRRLQEGT